MRHTREENSSRRCKKECARQESNLDMRLRRPPFYPLNYERVQGWTVCVAWSLMGSK